MGVWWCFAMRSLYLMCFLLPLLMNGSGHVNGRNMDTLCLSEGFAFPFFTNTMLRCRPTAHGRMRCAPECSSTVL